MKAGLIGGMKASAHLGQRRPAWLRTAALFAAMLGAPVLLSACQHSIEGTAAAYEADTPAGALYNRGLGYLNVGKFSDAIKSFDEVDRQHPYTEWARKSLVMSAFASYRKGDYDTAIQTANRYLTLYPGNADAAYAQYILGQSYFAQVPDVTRDQETTQKALNAMKEITTRYPDSEYAADARKKVIITEDQLAGKEMQVGRYYLERREYVAAINRFDTVVTQCPQTRHVEEALERLVEANLAMGLVREAQTAAAVLGHNFPDSSWYKDAYRLLDKKGLVPEDHGGAISQAVASRTS